MTDDQVWLPGDRELVEQALTVARQAGVSEAEIQQVLLEGRAGPQDGFVVPVLCGRLWYAARARRPGAAPTPSPFLTRPADDW